MSFKSGYNINLFRRSCGTSELFEVNIWRRDGFEEDYYITLVSAPCTLGERIKAFFQREHYWREILLTRADMEALRDILNEALPKEAYSE